MNKLFELLEAERPVIPDTNADYYIGYNNGLVMGQAIALKHDFEAVVRCKDCKHWKDSWLAPCGKHEHGYCHMEESDEVIVPRWDDNFCSYGERRTECG